MSAAGPSRRPSNRPASPRAGASSGGGGGKALKPRTTDLAAFPTSSSPSRNSSSATPTARSPRNSGTTASNKSSPTGSFFGGGGGATSPSSGASPPSRPAPLDRKPSSSRLLAAKQQAAGATASSSSSSSSFSSGPAPRASSPRTARNSGSGPRLVTPRTNSGLAASSPTTSSSRERSPGSSKGSPGSSKGFAAAARKPPGLSPLSVSSSSSSSSSSSPTRGSPSSPPLAPSSPRRLANNNKSPGGSNVDSGDNKALEGFSMRQRIALRRGSSRDIGALQGAAATALAVKGVTAGKALDGEMNSSSSSSKSDNSSSKQDSKKVLTKKNTASKTDTIKNKNSKTTKRLGGGCAAVVEPGAFETMELPRGLFLLHGGQEHAWRQVDVPAPTPLVQSGYVSGFMEAQCLDMHLHIVGAAVALKPSFSSSSSTSSTSSFDPFLRVSTVDIEAEEAAAAVAAAAAAVVGPSLSSPSSAPPPPPPAAAAIERFTRVVKNTTKPAWREDISFFGIEFNEVLCIELKAKSRDAKAKLSQMPSVCSTVFCVGDVMTALASDGDGGERGGGGHNDSQRIKFKLSGDEGSAVISAVVSFSNDNALFLKSAAASRDNKEDANGSEESDDVSPLSSSYTVRPCLSVNATNSCVMLTTNNSRNSSASALLFGSQ